MKAVVVDRELSSKEIEEIKALSSQGDWKIYSSSAVDGIEVQELKQLSAPKKKEINYETFDWVIHFGGREIGGKEIKYWLQFDNTSLWFYHKFRTYFYVRNLWYFIEELLLYSREFEEVKAYTNKRILKELSIVKENIEIIPGSFKKKKLSVLSLFNYSLFFVLRVIIGAFQYYRFHNKEYIIIDRPEIYQPTLQLDTLKTKKDNNYLAYVMKKGEDVFSVLDDVGFPKLFGTDTFRLRWRYFVNMRRKRRMCGELVFFSALFDKGLKDKLNQYDREFHESLSFVKEKSSDDLEKVIVDFLSSLRSSSKLYLFKYLAYKKFLKRKKFKSITTVDENSPLIKSILDAAKTHKIKTIGIQHGAIHELQPSYYNDEIRNIQSGVDLFFTWSDSWKRELLKRGYFSNSLISVGHIKSHIIEDLKIRKDSIRKKWNNCILFASQPVLSDQANYNGLDDLFFILNRINKYKILFKPHPSDDKKVKQYKEITIKNELDVVNFSFNDDLYELLYIADIVVTFFSSVGVEANYFRKPLFLLDYNNQDQQNYYRDGFGYKLINFELLDYALNNDSFLINYIKEIDDHKDSFDLSKSKSKKEKIQKIFELIKSD